MTAQNNYNYINNNIMITNKANEGSSKFCQSLWFWLVSAEEMEK